jgi:hypothetical protein
VAGSIIPETAGVVSAEFTGGQVGVGAGVAVALTSVGWVDIVDVIGAVVADGVTGAGSEIGAAGAGAPRVSQLGVPAG